MSNPIYLGHTETAAIADLDVLKGGIPGRAPTVATLQAFIETRPFYVTDFGAVGNGAVDDTAAIRLAVAAVPAAGGVIVFPRGTYKVTGIITLTGSNIAIEFERGASIAATVSAADGAIFYADTKNNISVTGGTFTGTFPWAVFIFRGSGHRVRGNTISGGTVPSTAHGTCGGVYVEEISDSEIDNNIVSGCGAGGIDAGADIQCNNGDTIATNVHITNNKCASTAVVCNILCYNPFRCRITGNTATGARVFASSTGAGGYGILVYKTVGMTSALIGDTVIAHNTTYATQGVGINSQGCPRVTIADNDVETPCTVQTEVSLSVAGIVSEAERGIVANNRVKNSGKAGIIISGAGSFSLVIGNSVYHPALEGIAIQGATPTDVTIIGNYVDTCTGQLAIGAWRFQNVAHTRIVVMGNVMRSVGQGVFFSALSVGCVVKGNIETDLSDTSYIANNLGTVALAAGNHATSSTGKNINFPEGVSPNRGDISVTLVPGVDYETQYFRTNLTANRTVTLSTTNARNGSRFRVIREGVGAFTLDVGGLKTIPSATKAFVDVVFTVDPAIGDFWVLAGYGTL